MAPSNQPILIASWNGGPATTKAAELHFAGVPLLDAIVEGIKVVEDDPEEMSVGFGGLPNEEGIVELDAAVMDGRTHKAGAVAGLRGIRHAAAVAREVLNRTDHALLVGEGALKFARQCGFKEEDLLTPKSRDAWLAWKAELSTRDGWISPSETSSDFGKARWAGHAENPTPGGPPPVVPRVDPIPIPHAPPPSPPHAAALRTPKPGDSGGSPRAPFTFGTIHVSGRDRHGDLASATSTSGLSYKIPGRAGDSPIVGAGLYTDNAVGSAGCTGRGEAALHNCAAFSAVQHMEAGLSPQDACLAVLKRIAKNTRETRLHRPDGSPTFNVTIYALRADGELGAAAMHEGYTYVTQRGRETKVEACAWLYDKTT